MRILANHEIRRLHFVILGMELLSFIVTEGYVLSIRGSISFIILFTFVVVMAFSVATLYCYFMTQDRNLENAAQKIKLFLDGNSNIRIECDEEGELYRLFHEINMLASCLDSKVNQEGKEKQFLKDTISDISHQLKTPLAALSIYNGLLQDAEERDEIKEFVRLSESEIDRINTLVQNLLKITRLDAGSIMIEKNMEYVSDMMKDMEIHFAYRAKQENKVFEMYGEDDVRLCCDREWIMEAIDNLIKNAFDHTKEGDVITVNWKKIGNSIVKIVIKDSGSGIHPEDIHHIFKRFYRSRFSQDTTGLGLGLSLAKAIIEAQDGSIEVDSNLGKGSSFIVNFWET